ncbi:MAG: DUF3592 domain-containing protein [Candidatus Peregrinibacteria bacterium]|nr:DUF3592 domain-containing protein [Candidatus Peregrinibacteria bacterium]
MHATRTPSCYLLSLFVVVPLCTGIFFFAKGLLTHPAPWNSESWPQTTATITGVSVTFSGHLDFLYFVEESKKYASFYANVNYQYEVGGREYAGDDATFVLDQHREHIRRPEAERRAQERFPIGGQIPVSFDPEAPARSTLQPGARSPATTDFLLGSVCFLVALWQGWSLRKSSVA